MPAAHYGAWLGKKPTQEKEKRLVLLLKTNISGNNSGFRKPWGKRQLLLLTVCNFLYRLSILVLVNFRRFAAHAASKLKVWSHFNLQKNIKRVRSPWVIPEACKDVNKIIQNCIPSLRIYLYKTLYWLFGQSMWHCSHECNIRMIIL